MNPSIAVARQPQNLMQDVAPPRPAAAARNEVFTPRQAPSMQARDNLVMSSPPAPALSSVSIAPSLQSQPSASEPAAQPAVSEHKAPVEHHNLKSTPVLAITFALLIAVGLMFVAYLAYKNSAALSANL